MGIIEYANTCDYDFSRQSTIYYCPIYDNNCTPYWPPLASLTKVEITKRWLAYLATFLPSRQPEPGKPAAAMRTVRPLFILPGERAAAKAPLTTTRTHRRAIARLLAA